MNIAESIELNVLDSMLQAKSVAEITETTRFAMQDVSRLEIDAGNSNFATAILPDEASMYTD